MFEFDAGSEGKAGPFLVWSARGTQDGEIPPKSFYIRDTSGKEQTEAFNKGVVLDIHSLKTGWQESSGAPGVAPKWVWGQTPSQLPAKPGEGYKKGFSMKVALGGGATAYWEQAGAAIWNALTALVPQIQSGPANDPSKVPVVRMVDTELMKFPTGSTIRPVLEIVKWIDRPEALKDGVAAGIDTGGDDAPAAKPAAAKAEPEPEPAEDDISF